MTARVFRYEVPMDDRPHVHHLAGDPLRVEIRPVDYVMEFWAVRNDAAAGVARAFQAFGTGHPLPDGATWRGTAARVDGMVFLARAKIAELLALGGIGVHRELTRLSRAEVNDIALEAISVFAVLDDRPGSACRWWRRYAERGAVR